MVFVVTPRRRALSGLSVLVLAAGISSCSGHSGPPGGTSVAVARQARAYLAAWSVERYAAAGRLTDAPRRASAGLAAAAAGLSATRVSFEPGAPRPVGAATAAVPFTARWTISGVLRPWTYTGRLAMRKPAHGDWQVHWEPADVHPRLTAGSKLVAERTLPDRAPIRDASGAALFTKADVVAVGIEPKLVKDLPSLASLLSTTLGVETGPLVAAVKAAKPDAFVPVITLRRSAYEKVKPKIYSAPGTVFQAGTRELAPSGLAPYLLGKVGPATADILTKLGPGYLGSDQVGTSGLQAALNPTLTGSAGATIAAVSTTDSNVAPDGQTSTPTQTVLDRIAPIPGKPVTTTLDRRVQAAADAALANVPQPTAIVAIRPSTGAILADAESPSAPFDIGLAGRYPAGSTFKIVTVTSLLERGGVPSSAALPCPGSVSVDGKIIHNENSFDLGSVSLQTAFAHSCNTTFASLAQKLDPTDLPTTAKQFGIGSGWTLPVPVFTGSLPTPADRTEQAVDAIGQGRVLVSPLSMAVAAAAVARGSTPTPTLVEGKPAVARHPFISPPAAVLRAVRPFMRATVTSGTAKLLAGVPGGPVAGKTGTAEFGTKTPPDSHAWFAGYQSDLAFAVFVEGGESSSTTAVPYAAAFLRALRS